MGEYKLPRCPLCSQNIEVAAEDEEVSRDSIGNGVQVSDEI